LGSKAICTRFTSSGNFSSEAKSSTFIPFATDILVIARSAPR